MTGSCTCHSLHPSGGFASPRDVQLLEEQVAKSQFLQAIQVTQPSINPNFEERWFTCAKCGLVWRLVYPDPPFQGFWGELPGDKP